jgi:hypothetical protein
MITWILMSCTTLDLLHKISYFLTYTVDSRQVVKVTYCIYTSLH